ncbi:MAG: ParB/RepB/Spo0J family partition protein [Oscillospiraceae bacterium]|nr:ParB/RepB/Spo0J family partition protein [Oscillospiraceae bacterium]
MAAKKKSGLGKGLDAIFAENVTEEARSGATELKLSELEPNRNQPRKDFDDEAMAELADSISQHGVLQPLLVRPIVGGGYQIVAGERRWRAARMAGLTTIPAVIRELDDEQVMEIALIENLQREDLSPLEEAMGYQSLMDSYDMTQEEVSQTVGKSRSAVANALRLLKLPQEVQSWIRSGDLSAGHGRALLAFQRDEDKIAVAEQIMKEDLSVRAVEKLAQKANASPKEKTAHRPLIPYFSEVELSLHDYLGRKVKVHGDDKKGTLQIEFYGQEDLSELMRKLNLNESSCQ